MSGCVCVCVCVCVCLCVCVCVCVGVCSRTYTRVHTRRGRRCAQADTAGLGWFDLPAPTVTPEVRRELELLRARGVLDPKRKYKAAPKALPKYFAVGHVVGGFAELPGRRVAGSFTEDLMRDRRLREYAKRNYAAVARRARSGGKVAFRDAAQARKPAWKRKLGS